MPELDPVYPVQDGIVIEAVYPVIWDTCQHRYAGIGELCANDADVAVQFGGERVYDPPATAVYCRDHINLPDRAWDRLADAIPDADDVTTLPSGFQDASGG